jgi:hypothetical protein
MLDQVGIVRQSSCPRHAHFPGASGLARLLRSLSPTGSVNPGLAMEFEFIDGVYGMATGFVVAFLLTVAYQLTTGKTMGFALGHATNAPVAMLEILVRFVAGPAILAQHALMQSAKGDATWGAIGIPLACLWSLLVGALIMQSLTQFGSF